MSVAGLVLAGAACGERSGGAAEEVGRGDPAEIADSTGPGGRNDPDLSSTTLVEPLPDAYRAGDFTITDVQVVEDGLDPDQPHCLLARVTNEGDTSTTTDDLVARVTGGGELITEVTAYLGYDLQIVGDTDDLVLCGPRSFAGWDTIEFRIGSIDHDALPPTTTTEPVTVTAGAEAELGQRYLWPDGLAITVVRATPFLPSAGATGAPPDGGLAKLALEITVENGTDTPYDPSTLSYVLEVDGDHVPEILDGTNDLEGAPEEPVPPGGTAAFRVGFAATTLPPGAALRISDGDHDEATFR